MTDLLKEFFDENGVPRFWYQGSCHCGGVQFSAAATRKITITRCNCSICYKSGHHELMVREEHFRLHRGGEYLKQYRFGNLKAEHTFCAVCGIKPFYRPRSHPTGFRSVNARCVEFPSDVAFEYVEFDGQNWAASMAAGQHKLAE